MTPNYPSKLYYSISEVASITGIKAHVLRYWETEFSTLKPKKTRTGSRRYRQVDIDEVLAIKTLLYEEGFKIAGALKIRRQARKKAREKVVEERPQLDLGFGQAPDENRQMGIVKGELKEILQMIRQLGSELTEKPSQGALKEKKGKG